MLFPGNSCFTHPTTSQLSMESRHHYGWKRPLISSSPTFNQARPFPLNCIAKCHIHLFIEHIQGWWQQNLWPKCGSVQQTVGYSPVHNSCWRKIRETPCCQAWEFGNSQRQKRNQSTNVFIPWNKIPVVSRAGSRAGGCPAGMGSSRTQPPIPGGCSIFVWAHQLLV